MIMQSGYASCEEKHKYVENVTFDGTLSGLINKLDELKESGFEFRGQANALWPVVSSIRRSYADSVSRHGLQIADCGFIDYCVRALAFLKREYRFLPVLSSGAGRTGNLYDHEIWGWAQHFGYKTPLIDFSHDYDVALYMATCEYWGRELQDGFFSVYALNGNCDTVGNELMRLERFIEREKDTLRQCGLNERGMFSFDTWKDVGAITIHKDGTCKPWDEAVAKERIASQAGMFVYLNQHDMSLEKYLYTQNLMNEGEDGVGCHLQKLKCLDVPLDMVPLIREYCIRKDCCESKLGLADRRLDDCLKCIASRYERMARGD